MTLLVAGWVAIDDIETPFTRVQGVLGGSATAAALGASLFTDVRLLAVVGEDFPGELRALLEGRNLDLAGLTVTGPHTSRWGGRYHYDMNTRDTVYTELGVNADWSPRLPPGWEHSDMVFLAPADPRVQGQIIDGLRSCRASMVDTIRFYIEGALDELRRTIGRADFLCINDSEARQLARVPGVARAARELRALGPQGVLVKLGEYGAAMALADTYFVAPGYPLEDVVDPTGAGDCFGGVVMGYLDSLSSPLTPDALRRAIIYASAVASFCVEGIGSSRLLSLTRPEVDARYREFRALTHFEIGE